MIIVAFAMACVVYADNIAVKPSDVITNIGNDITLPCQLAEGVTNEYVSWYEFNTKENGFQIFKSYQPDIVQNSEKFVVDTTEAKYNLNVINISFEDAGKYTCQTFQEQQRYPAYVTVYETPSCDNTRTSRESITLMCKIRYAGVAKPTLQWFRNGKETYTNVSVAYNTSSKDAHIATTNVTFDVSYEDIGANFMCRVSSTDHPEYVGDSCTSTPNWNDNEIKATYRVSATEPSIRDRNIFLISMLASLNVMVVGCGLADH
ncbi:unnamed protein product [Owenia fusiformis]|uniref:Ig-like domain-containing protein n=1 Tax=Owenia fusiformis TaxID=6347 RepID=A0A8S4NQN4_OWEFU|nr:unnamed protein product [Owenia fusiformis]